MNSEDEGYMNRYQDINHPHDYAYPVWHEAERVHDWKNYISEWLKNHWHSFTDEQKAAIAASAQETADREHWD